jgi:myo-inositol-1(or 4)-monophosphatase
MRPDWLAACHRAAEAVERMLGDVPTTPQRVKETGERGEGGDRTLEIDARAERLILDELDRLHRDEGARFTVVSEEVGRLDYGDTDVVVVIDPIDGSLNAKRLLPHHALSIGVAEGTTMADVVFGFVRDFGPGETWHATRGGGAFLDGARLPTDIPERRHADGKLEVLGIESADPRWVRDAADELADAARRVRALGSMAITLCQVAGARMDAMVSIRDTRAVDVAAAQLIVREAGGQVAFTAFEEPLGAPLDLEPHSPVIAARTPHGLAGLRNIPL